MSIDQTYTTKTRSSNVSSLATFNSCQTTLTVPSLSVKSTSSVKRLSRRECRKLFQKTVFQPKISTYTKKNINHWDNQSHFHNFSSSSYSSKTTNISVQRLINRVEASKGQTQIFYRKRKNKNSCIKRICTPYSCICLCLCPLLLTILGAFITALILFTKLPTVTSITTTSITIVPTTVATTSTTVTTMITTTSTFITTLITTVMTSSTSTTSASTTTMGTPSCSTCMVTYTDNYAIPLGNLSCNDACQTTNYYKSASIKFPSISSSCNAIVTTSSNGTYCTYYSVHYYSTNNIITYYGISYGNYSNGPYSGIGYFANYLAHCIDNNNYYCCCT